MGEVVRAANSCRVIVLRLLNSMHGVVVLLLLTDEQSKCKKNEKQAFSIVMTMYNYSVILMASTNYLQKHKLSIQA